MTNRILINSGKTSPLFFSIRGKLLKSLQREGYEITITGNRVDCDKEIENYDVHFEDVNVSRAGLNIIDDIRLFFSYYNILKTKEYSVVHSYTAKPNIYGSIAARIAGVKYIFPTVNGLGYAFTDCNTTKKKATRSLLILLYKISFKCATKVFFQNSDDANELVQYKAIEKNKCVILSGSGIDTDLFPSTDCCVSPMRFLMATRLLYTKGVVEYCEAAKIVKTAFPETVFLLAGAFDSSPDGVSHELIQSYVELGAIDYLGHVKQMQDVLENASVFVLPSFYREGVPHAILEAMSTGRAIITTNSPGCRETVNGQNGFLVEAKNYTDLAQKMIWMVEHPQMVLDMGLESRKLAETRFDVNLVNSIIINTIKNN